MPRILDHFCHDISDRHQYPSVRLLGEVPALQPYFVERQGSSRRVQIYFAYPMLSYIIHFPVEGVEGGSRWQSGKCYKPKDWHLSFYFEYRFQDHSSSCTDSDYCDCDPEDYVCHTYTSHTPNDVLSAQADCPTDLSLDEFIAFAHLQGAGSLRWPNIMQGPRSRSLNLRRHQVHCLLAYAAFQVGPLDPKTGEWTWHQELQDSSFCDELLDELDSLLVDTGAHSIDAVLMNTISLLLTRVLASSPSEEVSDRAVALLRSVRRKTFDWVQDLSYDLAQAPTNEERRDLLLEMAVTCRSTFDVDPATLRKAFYSTEDVDVLLSCGFFIHALHQEGMSNCRVSRIIST